jgi:hypothetical protein
VSVHTFNLPSEDFSQNGNASAIHWPYTPNPWTRSCARMNGPWASLSRVWVLISFCFAILSKGGDNSRSTHEASFVLDLSSQPTFKGTLCFLQPLDLRTEVYFDSINVDTAVVDYVSASGSTKRVGRCLCFHQACTPGVCEAFLVVCGSDHTSSLILCNLDIFIFIWMFVLFFACNPQSLSPSIVVVSHLSWESGIKASVACSCFCWCPLLTRPIRLHAHFPLSQVTPTRATTVPGSSVQKECTPFLDIRESACSLHTFLSMLC